jgi:imidazolonepropionase-like amidohydrolase
VIARKVTHHLEIDAQDRWSIPGLIDCQCAC